MKKKFRFVFYGTIKKFETVIGERELTTYAESCHKALSNLLFQIKKSNGYIPSIKITLSGKLTCFYTLSDETHIVKNNRIEENFFPEFFLYCKEIKGTHKYKCIDQDSFLARDILDSIGDSKFTREQFLEFISMYEGNPRKELSEYSGEKEDGVHWKNDEMWGEYKL